MSDGGKILAVGSIYSIIFGILFGECVGEYGRRLLALHPIWIERRTAIVPMLLQRVDGGREGKPYAPLKPHGKFCPPTDENEGVYFHGNPS